MYLLEAKKKAEKKEKELMAEVKKQEREKQRAALAAAKQVKRSGGGAEEAQRALAEADRKKQAQRGGGQAEAARALKEAEARSKIEAQQAALRRKQEETEMAEAIRRSKHDAEVAARNRAERAKREGQLRAQAAQRQKAAPPPNQGIKSAPLQGARKIGSYHAAKDSKAWRDLKFGCKYIGTFEVNQGKLDKKTIIDGMRAMSQYASAARDACILICQEGIKVIDSRQNKIAMAHSLIRISMASTDDTGNMFCFVAKNPQVADRFAHVFDMDSRRDAEDCQGQIMKAFRSRYAAHATLKRKKAGKPVANPGPKTPATPDPQRKANKEWARHNPLLGVPHRGEMMKGSPSAGRKNSQDPPKRPSGSTGASKQIAAAEAAAEKAAADRSGADNSDAFDYSTPSGEKEKEDTNSGPWYQPGIPREIAMELLEQGDEGSFIIRDSSSQPGSLAMTIRATGLMHHYIIRKVPEGWILGSPDQGQMPIPDLATLVIAYSRAKGCLPHVLNLDTFNKLEEDDVDDEDIDDSASFVDPDYQSIQDVLGEMKARGGR